jgi:DinB family protein
MRETAEQYIARILGNLEGQNPLKVQGATPQKLGQLLKGVPAAKLRKKPAPDKWSVAEIVAHLADAELVAGWRLRAILGAPGTPIQAYDQNAWVEAGQYAKKDPRTSVAQFRAFRDANLALMKSLKPEQWKLHGLHAERGEESVERLSQLMAGHDINHLRQIQGILSAKNPVTKSNR